LVKKLPNKPKTWQLKSLHSSRMNFKFSGKNRTYPLIFLLKLSLEVMPGWRQGEKAVLLSCDLLTI
jgi:hypothetical protein